MFNDPIIGLEVNFFIHFRFFWSPGLVKVCYKKSGLVGKFKLWKKFSNFNGDNLSFIERAPIEAYGKTVILKCLITPHPIIRWRETSAHWNSCCLNLYLPKLWLVASKSVILIQGSGKVHEVVSLRNSISPWRVSLINHNGVNSPNLPKQ